MSEQDDVMGAITQAMAEIFRIPAGYTVTRETTAADVEGWDSLSHAILMMKVEEICKIELPVDRIYDLANVGELADIVAAERAQKR